jgi:glycosyltransferase involved in cell wall biosynthesis
MKQGVSDEKINVVPLAYESKGHRYEAKRVPSNRPLRVIWLGTVSLSKGIQYLVEAARELESASVEFSVVGPVQITEKAVSFAPSNMTFHGRVPRDEVDSHYRNADVFVLPTLSDGFAITQLEAMDHGLPVVTTPNCGRVVSNGKDGFVVPPRDSEALAEALLHLAENRNRIYYMSKEALATSATYSLDRVADQLTSIVESNTD